MCACLLFCCILCCVLFWVIFFYFCSVFPSVLWYCWLFFLIFDLLNCLPDNLYWVGGEIKPCSINQSSMKLKTQVPSLRCWILPFWTLLLLTAGYSNDVFCNREQDTTSKGPDLRARVTFRDFTVWQTSSDLPGACFAKEWTPACRDIDAQS